MLQNLIKMQYLDSNQPELFSNRSYVHLIIFSSYILEDGTSEEIENLLKELSVMKVVGKHNNIISLLGCCTRGGK
jgi:hypothetical protein